MTDNIECNHCGRDNLEFDKLYKGDNGYLECPHCACQFLSIPNKVKLLWGLYNR